MNLDVRRLATALCLIVSTSPLSQARPQEAGLAAPKLSVTVVVENATEVPAWVRKLSTIGPFEIRTLGRESVGQEVVASTDAIVLAALPQDAGRAHETLSAARARGISTVLVGRTALELPPPSDEVDPLSRKLPLSATAGKTGSDARRATPLTVEVLDQRAIEVQCFTHFHHSGWLPSSSLTLRAQVLARAFERGSSTGEVTPKDAERRPVTVPVVWTSGRSFGRFRREARTVVTTLDPSAGPSSSLVLTLIGRAIEAGAGRRATVKISGDYSLVTETLGPNDHGIAQGVPPRKGFFRGRQISQVMSFHGASWLTRESRESEERPEAVLRAIGVLPGQMVADVGCGNGYFSLRMAKKVAPEGKVYGVDIQKEMLELLRERAAAAGVKNLVPVLATASDPKLPAEQIDMALMVDVYHELSDPVPVIAGVRRALKKDGRLVLVEYRGEDPTVQIKPLHRTTVEQMRGELGALGFRLIENKTFLPSQHILIFGKKPAKKD